MKRAYFVAVTTYQRPRLLAALLEQLRSASYRHPSIEVCVLDDGSEPPAIVGLDPAHRCRPGWSFHRNEHEGKRGFWRVWDRAFRHFAESGASHLVMLQDDVELCAAFFDLLDGIFERVEVCNVHRCWFNRTGVRGSGRPRPTSERVTRRNGTTVRLERIGWVDGLWAASRRTITGALGARMHPIERPWDQLPRLGSGCGGQVSERLRAAGVPIHGCSHSLVLHRGEESVMHPGRRDALIKTRRFIDG